MSFSVERIDHVEVFVRNIDAAAEWYAKVLGLQEVCRWNPEPVMIGADDTKLALFCADPAVPEEPGEGNGRARGWRRVAWRTDQEGFEAAQQHLEALGIDFHGPVDHDFAWSIYFKDPDGNPLEITYYA